MTISLCLPIAFASQVSITSENMSNQPEKLM